MVAQLQRAVFGAGSDGRAFAHCVYLSSLAQAVQALELVTASLLDVVCPANCLSLFNAAAACGCMPLRRSARALALASFPTAFQQDPNGLITMPEPELIALLCSDRLQVRDRAGETAERGGGAGQGICAHSAGLACLGHAWSGPTLPCRPAPCHPVQVESEVQVFQALTAWTECAPAARTPGFAARLARCVRITALTMPDLHFLDAHPLVRVGGWAARGARCGMREGMGMAAA